MVYVLVVLISFITTSYLVLRDPWVQTLSARIASHYLSTQLHTEIKITGFDLSFRHGLTIDDICIRDQHRMELFSAHKLSIIPGKYSITKKYLNVRSVFIDKGLIQLVTHRGDTDLNLKFIIDYFTPKASFKPYDTVRGPKWHFFVAKVELDSTRFHFQDENKPLRDTGMDYANIDIKDINLLIRAFHPEGDTLYGRIDRLSATERSGFSIHSMSGDFQVGPAFLKAHHLKLVTNHSDLDLTFDFLYDHWDAYNDFLNKIHIRAAINPSYLDLQDIGAFAPVLYVMKDRFKIEGTIKGTVSNFSARDFKIAYGSRTRFTGNIHSYGLPNVEETFADVNIRDFKTDEDDIRSLNLPIEGKNLDIPAFLKNAGVFNLKGNFTGFYNDFVANADLNTDIGELKTDLTLRKQKGIKGLLYNGEADVAGLHLGQLFKSKAMLGPITLRADLNGRGFTLNDATVKMNVWIDSVSLNQYTYRHITLQGGLEDKNFTGQMKVDDRNLDLDFNGTVNLGDTIPSFNFVLQLNYAQLFAMNLLKRDSTEDLSAHVKADFRGNNIDNIEGVIRIDSSRYHEGRHTIKMDHLSLLTSRDIKNNKAYHLLSDFVDADIFGNFYFKDLIPSLSTFISNYLASFHLNEKLINHHPSTSQLINYVVKLKKTDPVMEVFIPFLRVAPNTLLEGSYHEDEGVISLNGNSPDISLNGNHFTGWFIKATSRQENLNVQTGCDKFFVLRGEKKDSALIMMDSLHLVSNLHHDTIFYDIFWNMRRMKSDLGGFVNFKDSTSTHIKLTRFHAFIDHNYWTMAKDNEVIIDSSAMVFHDLAFESGEQKLKIDGRAGTHPEDTLRFNFNKVDISDADYLLGNPNVDIDGILSGNLDLMNVRHSLTVLSDLDIDNFAFNKEPLGKAKFKVFYNDKDARFDVDSKIYEAGDTLANMPLSLKGSYYLGKPEASFNFDLALKNMKLKMFSPFVSSFMSRLSGVVSGDVQVTGSPDMPRVAGKLELVHAGFKINYLNIPYSVSDVVTVDSTAFDFDHVAVYDSLGNRAYLNGKIYHNYFHNLELDLSIDPEDFSVFRNNYAQNNIFYGTARGTGNVRITGPPDNISINAKAETGGGTSVHIPISSAADISQNDYIIFSKPRNDTIRNEEPFPGISAQGLSFSLALKVNPSADVEVSFPDQMGNIRGSGRGNLTMGMTPTGGFTLTGSYVIQSGSFRFQVKNLMRLNFAVQNGSRITWSGDPANANINMTAIYSTRVPLGDLGKEDEKNTRIPVECIIRLSGQLSNPDISFGLNLPDATETTNTEVYGAIDTTNKVEMNQQMFNILVFNQFQTGKGAIPSNIDVGTTSLSFFMGQVNSLLSRVSKDVNIGVDYRKATNTPGQEIDVAVSTQLFNERLLIDGLFGVNSINANTTAQKASTIVGDVKIEYILTKNWRWRIRAFNRTNTIDLLSNYAPYTQGLGLSYQRDFNHWGDFFKSDKIKNKTPVRGISR